MDILVLAIIAGVLGVSIAFAYDLVQRLRRSLRQIHQQVDLMHGVLSEIRLDQTTAGLTAFEKRIDDRLVRLNDALRVTSDPSEIVIGVSDSYEHLDQNWNSINDTSGRHLLTTSMDGPHDRLAVIVVVDQSNGANHGADQYIARRRVENFNIYDGKCFHAADPLLGASDSGGNFATRLGDKLIAGGLSGRVILAPIAMGGTTAESWATEGIFNPSTAGCVGAPPPGPTHRVLRSQAGPSMMRFDWCGHQIVRPAAPASDRS